MDNNNTTTTATVENPAGAAQVDPATVTTTGAEDTITMSKADFNKQVQSEADKVRRELSDKIAEYKRQIEELTPVKKTDAELDYEKRIAALEAREKAAKLKDDLTSNEIPVELGEYLKDDTDIKAFSEKYKEIVKNAVDKYVKDNGFSPANHKSGESITKEEFAKMTYDERAKLYNENIELYRYLADKK